MANAIGARTASDMTVAGQLAFFKNILESSIDYSIVATDLEGRILYWNEGARRSYDYSAEDLVGKGNVRILHTPEDLGTGAVSSFMEKALQTGKAEAVFQRVRSNGCRFTATVALALQRDAAGSPIGFVLISRDITEQTQLAAQELRRHNEELADTAGSSKPTGSRANFYPTCRMSCSRRSTRSSGSPNCSMMAGRERFPASRRASQATC
ncbi:MAG TPA: PAS domain S-box protein [Candidatus Binataceae bacterium]|jgi:PAS domain S-box-containing protein|nr:PAS domain S-box protein [Candidatus Binataceae bacterium]